MGMFDNIIDYTLKCPYCGQTGHLEIQTKSLDCQLDRYYARPPTPKPSPKKKGLNRLLGLFGREEPKVPTGVKEVVAYGSCSSPLCTYVSRLRQIPRDGYFSGFGRGFDVTYKVSRGRIVAPAVSVRADETPRVGVPATLKRDFLKKTSDDPRWKACLAKCGGDFGIAVLMYNAPPTGRHPWWKAEQPRRRRISLVKRKRSA